MAEAGRPSLVREYISTLLRWWWLIVATVFFSGGYEVVNYVLGLFGYQLSPPRWVGWALGAVALVIAQFLAFREMRKQRDTAEANQAISRPRVKLSAGLVNQNNARVTHFEAENFGESVAVNVAAHNSDSAHEPHHQGSACGTGQGPATHIPSRPPRGREARICANAVPA